MSWDGYLDDLAQKGVERCGIFGKEDGNPWCNASLKYKPDDIKVVKEALEKDGTDSDVFQTGITMDDAKWTVVSIDKEQKKMVLKGKNEHKNKAMCCCLTNKCLIIGTSENDKPAQEVLKPMLVMQQHIQDHGL